MPLFEKQVVRGTAPGKKAQRPTGGCTAQAGEGVALVLVSRGMAACAGFAGEGPHESCGALLRAKEVRPWPEMISLEEARSLVLSYVSPLDGEVVPLLEACGRASTANLSSDIDISPFAHSAMDGFALRAARIAGATEETPVALEVIAEEAAGEAFEGPIGDGECVRIMTGAPLPADADSVVKYEVVAVVDGDGKPGSTVAFAAPTETGSNVRQAGEEAHAGDAVIHAGDVIGTAGAGFLASCGILEVPVHRRPVVGVLAIGSSELGAAAGRAHAGEDPQFQQLCHGGMRKGGRCRAAGVSHSGRHVRGLKRGGACRHEGVRFRAYHRRCLQWRFPTSSSRWWRNWACCS